MNVITLKQHRYHGKLKNIGDEYDFVGKQQRRLAIAMGWVAVVPKVEKIKEPEFNPLDSWKQQAETINEVEEQEPIKPKRTYRRRNLTAEE